MEEVGEVEGVDGVEVVEGVEEVEEVGDPLVCVLEDAVLSPVPATEPSHICPIGQHRTPPPDSWVQSVPAYCNSSLLV